MEEIEKTGLEIPEGPKPNPVQNLFFTESSKNSFSTFKLASNFIQILSNTRPNHGISFIFSHFYFQKYLDVQMWRAQGAHDGCGLAKYGQS